MKISNLKDIQGLDLYLLDQILKGRLHKNLKVLDAGCGSGRNTVVLNHLGFDIKGFDPNIEHISALEQHFPELKNKLVLSSIEEFPLKKQYDYIIVNAVLHFAQSHAHFEILFDKLVQLLTNTGQLFIRMTSNLATEKPFKTNSDGIAYLPDESFRYLLELNRLDLLIRKHTLQWVEPIKTTNVAGLRCMSTVILEKNLSIG